MKKKLLLMFMAAFVISLTSCMKSDDEEAAKIKNPLKGTQWTFSKLDDDKNGWQMRLDFNKDNELTGYRVALVNGVPDGEEQPSHGAYYAANESTVTVCLGGLIMDLTFKNEKFISGKSRITSDFPEELNFEFTKTKENDQPLETPIKAPENTLLGTKWTKTSIYEQHNDDGTTDIYKSVVIIDFYHPFEFRTKVEYYKNDVFEREDKESSFIGIYVFHGTTVNIYSACDSGEVGTYTFITDKLLRAVFDQETVEIVKQ